MSEELWTGSLIRMRKADRFCGLSAFCVVLDCNRRYVLHPLDMPHRSPALPIVVHGSYGPNLLLNLGEIARKRNIRSNIRVATEFSVGKGWRWNRIGAVSDGLLDCLGVKPEEEAESKNRLISQNLSHNNLNQMVRAAGRKGISK